MKKIELLAPAGDSIRLKYALEYGADAVYIGGKSFGLRANTANFTNQELKEAVLIAHNLNKKIYITINIIMHNKEIKKLREYLLYLESINVDAIIVSDASVIELAKKHTNLEIHLSTQASVLNKYAIKIYKNLGISRIVLGRETTKEDIEEIVKEGIEIETFIHGAMCSSYSGRCVMSNYLTNRDANRGGCSQICRWDFNLLENNQNITASKEFTFSTKDLSMITNIKSMIELGITSLKVEGRMRSLYYIASVISSYRELIDNIYNNTLTEEKLNKIKTVLDRCANRESIPQFYNSDDMHNYQYYNGRHEPSNQDFLGIVKNYNKKTKIATIEQRNYFKTNDEIEIFGPNNFHHEFIIKEIKNDKNETIDIVRHPRQIITIKIEKELKENYLIRSKQTN